MFYRATIFVTRHCIFSISNNNFWDHISQATKKSLSQTWCRINMYLSVPQSMQLQSYKHTASFSHLLCTFRLAYGASRVQGSYVWIIINNKSRGAKLRTHMLRKFDINFGRIWNSYTHQASNESNSPSFRGGKKPIGFRQILSFFLSDQD